MENPKSIEGGCLCGATRYRATGEPYKARYCHCSWCRKATGAPVVAWIMYEAGQLEFIAGSPQKYASSPGVLRGHCPVCGTPLSYEGMWDDKQIQMVTSGSLDDPEHYPPSGHAFCHNQVSWLKMTDDLPRYPQSSPAK